MQPLESLLLRLLTAVGDVYYLLLVPVLCLYLAIFVSNKLHSHQQQRQQQLPQHHTAHRRPSADTSEATSASSAHSNAAARPTSHSFSPSLSYASDDELSASDSAPSSSPSSPSFVAASPSATEPSSSSPSSQLSLTFLMPDQSLVSHCFPATASVGSVISTLYPPPSALAPSARIIYQGRLLHSASPLSQHSMAADDMVHVHLLHSAHSSEGETLLGGGAAGAVNEPPAALVCVLALMCAALGCGWGVFVVCGDVLYDMAGLAILLCSTGVTAVGVLYAHACTVSPRPAVVPM